MTVRWRIIIRLSVSAKGNGWWIQSHDHSFCGYRSRELFIWTTDQLHQPTIFFTLSSTTPLTRMAQRWNYQRRWTMSPYVLFDFYWWRSKLASIVISKYLDSESDREWMHESQWDRSIHTSSPSFFPFHPGLIELISKGIWKWWGDSGRDCLSGNIPVDTQIIVDLCMVPPQ